MEAACVAPLLKLYLLGRCTDSNVARLMWWINWRISSGTFDLPPRERLPSPEQAKPGTVPADDRLRLDDHKGVQNAGRKPIKARKNEAIKIAENKPLRRFSLQHIELVAKRPDLRIKQGSRPEKPGDQPPDQFEHIHHEPEHRPIRGFMPAGRSLR
jgi:hypothetical protein